MALDLEKTRKNAERLLKQGRVQAALEEYQRLAEESPRDLPLLNFVGDLLSRMGRDREAIVYYEKIAAEYARSGFFLKAVAILKKVLRAEPQRADVMHRIGDLYLKQRLPGEGRGYLLQAADRFVAARSFREAQEVYRKLAEAEPADPLHRLRLAESMAAEGNAAGAGSLLQEVGDTLRGGGRLADAEKIYRRALELAPGKREASEGLAKCLAAQGRAPDAVALLSRALEARPDASLSILLFSIEEQAGRHGQALKVLTGTFADAMPDDAFERVLRAGVEQGTGETVWAAFDTALSRWTTPAMLARRARLLGRLARVEPEGHIPALKRLHDVYREMAEGAGIAAALEALARAYRAKSMSDEASAVEERLREIAPSSPGPSLASEEAAGPGDDTAPPPAAPVPSSAAEEAGEEKTEARLPAAIAAPAVPLGAADEEFVNGRLTQAEIFEKYGLMEQAVEQLRAITKRFPGLVPAQQRLVDLLRDRGDRVGLQDALVGLAVAHRASGDHARARDAAEKAGLVSALDPGTQVILERLSLLEPVAASRPESAPEARRPAAEPAPGQVARPPAAEPADRATPVEPRRPEPVKAAPARGGVDDEIVIEIEDEEPGPSQTPEREPQEQAAAPVGPPTSSPLAAAAPPAEPPSPDDLEEIAFYVEQGMILDARSLIASHRARGRGGDALDALEARVGSAKAPPAEEEPVVEAVDETAGRSDLILDDAALESISEALGTNAAAPEPTAPAAFDEQSVEEVFELFKRHVDEEIGRDDHRTHYDLGIAYKEMGLLDDAVSEFQIACRAPEIFRDACSMIALCFREKGEIQEAAGWYRQALDAPGGDDAALRGLRFDLAEVLEQSGETQAALDIFRSIHADDPSYREVGRRISELEERAR